ncbi:type VI secretion system contractile sheath small subunit [Paraburkholderia terricola]|jgi:type VI secretion system protein ImpB|uniref:Type VI secretion system protein ImpB n=1 Tax=Paraburkholderia terricola TaxID=169427 RepID=A0ABU1M0S5_9BURK|nr:type VI secretion system contractile sheath small subunit [Paraburkholderia terricola]MDR6412614.1 type VI secretion system protein ImpB [Paraburkholderia terricola]MDR6450199.1 type VI secretion system protein ImpB [Paraburkholderia terricola]MDR6485034.1 type VI secretion system protein ImpB [Paraburkholderia terricola]
MSRQKLSSSGQKQIARNRAPRVQIEYDVELYGAQQKVQLPFVMGVLADLAGHRATPLPDLAERKFMEIDVDSFDERMKAVAPALSLEVDNTLTGDGRLKVDVAFQSMDDFAPAALARHVEPLRRLLEARTELANLLSYIDGKRGAEQLIARALANPALLAALAGTGASDGTAQAGEAPRLEGGEDHE